MTEVCRAYPTGASRLEQIQCFWGRMRVSWWSGEAMWQRYYLVKALEDVISAFFTMPSWSPPGATNVTKSPCIRKKNQVSFKCKGNCSSVSDMIWGSTGYFNSQGNLIIYPGHRSPQGLNFSPLLLSYEILWLSVFCSRLNGLPIFVSDYFLLTSEFQVASDHRCYERQVYYCRLFDLFSSQAWAPQSY